VKLSELWQELASAGLVAHSGRDALDQIGADFEIADIVQDSRVVTNACIFVARPGKAHDGLSYAKSAIDRGARAVCMDPISADRWRALAGDLATRIPILESPDPLQTIGLAAHRLHGSPSASVQALCVTGTNGKTTVTTLVQTALDRLAGKPVCGRIGTTGNAFGQSERATAFTTPESDDLARLLAWMKAQDAAYVAMEASSIALEAKRLVGLMPHVVAFTNLTQDHLDYHGTMDAYGFAKRRLFHEFQAPHAVYNIGDAFGARLFAEPKAHNPNTYTISTNPVGGSLLEADFALLACEAFANAKETGTRGKVRLDTHEVSFSTPLLGRHNLENALVGTAILKALGLDVEAAFAAILDQGGAAGRLERCDTPEDDVVALVDYAHTPDALTRALRSLQSYGRVICVFGAGGDRDPSKRAPMGQTVAELATIAILTNDNPRSEDPRAIARAVASGLQVGMVESSGTTKDKSFEVILDRRAAIAAAVARAKRGDVILVAGKGHETYQIVGAETHSFDDRLELRDALAKRRSGSDKTNGAD
jgi:UDP-N-acetylmuramoyl-L-alanyl-D-glutamate--2,6-diaminopimelate ligase